MLVTLRQRIRFYQQLAVLMRAGLAIRAGLSRLKERIGGRQMTVLSEKVEAGERLGEAFASAGFSTFECHLVTAGEKSGHLDTIFEHLAEYWNRELEMRQALIRPLYYPLSVLHLAVFVGALVEAVTTSWNVAALHCVLAIVTLYVAGFVIFIVLKVSWSSPAMRSIWLAVPIIGSALRSTYAYRWITALKLEFTAGISLYRAVGDAWRASGYPNAEGFAEEGEQSMREGVDLSKLIQRWKPLPRDWIDFVETGELSGALEATFTNLEAEAARSWKLAQERMADWLPKMAYFAILLVVAVIVGRLMYQVEVAPIEQINNMMDGK
jgi:type II secretory pathway component PulF